MTQAQYAAVMSGNTNNLNPSPSNWANNPNRPVEKVVWDDVQIFPYAFKCERAGGGPLAERMELCIADRVAMGICLPGRHDHGVFVGDDDRELECKLFMSG